MPLFAEHQRNGNEAVAWQSSIELVRLALFPTSLISLILFALPGQAVWLLAPGLGAQTREWTCFFFRWFSLSLVPLLCSGAAIGLLYAQRVFWTGTAAQLVYNLTVFTCILLFGGALLGPVSIMLGVLLATSAFMLLQFVKLISAIRSAQILPHPPCHCVVQDSVRKGIRLAVPLLVLAFMNQGTAIIAVWSLSGACVGTIAEMGYAGKLMQLALVFPDVMGTVLFPKFALKARASDREELRDLATRAMRMALFIGLPIACTFFALRMSLVELLFRHGAFSEIEARRVALLFGLSLMGMPARVVFFYQVRIFYALEDTWWPACVTFISMIFALLVMPAAAKQFGAGGIAASYTALAWIGAAVQGYVLRLKYAACHNRSLLCFALRISVPAVSAAWLGVSAGQTIDALLANATLAVIVKMFSGTSLAILSYWLMVIAAQIPEAQEIRRYVRWQSAPALNAAKAVIRG